MAAVLLGVPVVPISDGSFIPCEGDDGGHPSCPLEVSRGRAPVQPLLCVMEATLPSSPPLRFVLRLLHRAKNNHDKSETLPWTRQGAENSG